MTDTSTTLEAKTQTLTPELVRSKMQIALTKAEQSTQALHDAESKLVYNEDNLGEISKFIEQCKAAEKIVETERVALKEPYLQTGKNIDAGAKLVSTDLVGLRTKAHTQYSKLCMEVERKRQEAARETQRVKAIKDSIDNFFMAQSTAIANATEAAELVRIEKLIGSHKANSSRYGEFLPLMGEKASNLTDLIKEQKEALKKLEGLKSAEKAAELKGDDQEILDSREAQEQLTSKIQENKEAVQERGINMATSAETFTPQIVLPEIKGIRTYWKWELVDEKAATKAGLTLVIPNKEVIEEILKQKRKDGIEIQENGIRYYKHFEY